MYRVCRPPSSTLYLFHDTDVLVIRVSRPCPREALLFLSVVCRAFSFGRVILHRPDDPMVFCRDLLERNIEERGGNSTPFDPACAPRLLKVRRSTHYSDALPIRSLYGFKHGDSICAVVNGICLYRQYEFGRRVFEATNIRELCRM